MLQKDKTKVKETQSGKYLTFKLRKEEFGLAIHKVIEIIEMQDITPVPRTPDYIRGVINLRGIIHPVIDLNQKFGLGSTRETDLTCIIIVILERGEDNQQFGVIVDQVSEVEDIDDEDIDETPRLGTIVEDDFIMGMAKNEASVKMLLDIEKILSQEELRMLSKVSKNENKQNS